EVDPGPPCGEIADGPGDRCRAQGSTRERQRNRELPREQRERARVGAEPEIRGMAEGNHSRVAHDEVERECQEPENEELGQDRELVARAEPRGSDEQTADEPEENDERPPHYSSSPKTPVRTRRTSPPRHPTISLF